MLAIIQARSSSKRFKNKVMFKIRDKPLIWYVYNSVRKSKYVKKIIISIMNFITPPLFDYSTKKLYLM